MVVTDPVAVAMAAHVAKVVTAKEILMVAISQKETTVINVALKPESLSIAKYESLGLKAL
ncbi:hypothetical protein D3C87_1840590 [compost metagenome]